MEASSATELHRGKGPHENAQLPTPTSHAIERAACCVRCAQCSTLSFSFFLVPVHTSVFLFCFHFPSSPHVRFIILDVALPASNPLHGSVILFRDQIEDRTGRRRRRLLTMWKQVLTHHTARSATSSPVGREDDGRRAKLHC